MGWTVYYKALAATVITPDELAAFDRSVATHGPKLDADSEPYRWRPSAGGCTLKGATKIQSSADGASDLATLVQALQELERELPRLVFELSDDFVWTDGIRPHAADARAASTRPPPAVAVAVPPASRVPSAAGEKIATLGIVRDNALMYYIKGGDVWATPRKLPGEEPGKARLIAVAGVDMDYSQYLYYLDGDGDVARKRRQVS